MPKDCVKLKMAGGMKRPAAVKACYSISKAKKMLKDDKSKDSGYGDVVYDKSGKSQLKNYRYKSAPDAYLKIDPKYRKKKKGN